MKILVLLAAALLASACECEQTAWQSVTRCVRSHNETNFGYGIGGTPVGGQQWGSFGPQLTYDTKCDEYQTKPELVCIDRKWPWE